MPRSSASSEQAELMIPVPPMNSTRMTRRVGERAPAVNRLGRSGPRQRVTALFCPQSFSLGARDRSAVDSPCVGGIVNSMTARARRAASVPVESHQLGDDGRFFNSKHPALIYRGALPASSADLAGDFEALFEDNGWPPAWRAGLYTQHHYHASAHEVLGIFCGWVHARLGGENGPLVTLRAGDAVLIPAGVAHKNEGESPDFRAVGAYPRGMRVDMRYGREAERKVDGERIAALPAPAPDPVFGYE
jgi:uncharacterized protein YjlB